MQLNVVESKALLRAPQAVTILYLSHPLTHMVTLLPPLAQVVTLLPR